MTFLLNGYLSFESLWNLQPITTSTLSVSILLRYPSSCDGLSSKSASTNAIYFPFACDTPAIIALPFPLFLSEVTSLTLLSSFCALIISDFVLSLLPSLTAIISISFTNEETISKVFIILEYISFSSLYAGIITDSIPSSSIIYFPL